MTLLQIVDKLQTIGLSQPNVRTAGEGNIYDFLNNNPSVKYGVFFITQNSHIEYEDNERYGLTLFYVDRLEDDMESNRLRIQSHGKQVLSNILTMFCNSFDIDFPEATYTSFTQKFVDECAGCYVNILIEIYKDTICEDGESPVWEKIGVLQNKDVTITENGDYDIYADAGYDGIKSVNLTVSVVDTDCFQRGYNSGHTDGMADQKALLSSTALTENGTYTSENGFSAVTVSVHPNTTNLTTTVNGEFTPPSGFIGYSAVTVNVNSGECNMQTLYVSLITDNNEPVTSASFTVKYADQEDVYTYLGVPQEVAVYPGLDYVIEFGEYEHYIAPSAVSGISSWGKYDVVTAIYNWESVCYVDPESVELEATGSSATIEVVADGAWTASCVGDWYVPTTTTGTGDGSINVSAVENNTGEMLEGYVNITFYDGTTGSTYVSQKAVTYLNVSDEHILFEHSGSSYHLEVSSNTAYTITAPNWITYEYVDNLLVLTASDLGNSQGRHDYVVFTYDGHTKAIDVNQVNPDYIMYVASSGTFTTEELSNNSVSITNNNEGGETFIGSNCQNVLSSSTVPNLEMFAVDIPTTSCVFHSCSCDVNSHIDLMVLPKGVVVPSTYNNAYSAFNGLDVDELRINCALPAQQIYNDRAITSLAFDRVGVVKIGPDVSGLTNYVFVKDYVSQTSGDSLNGYVYTTYAERIEFYQPTPYIGNNNTVIKTLSKKIWYVQYAGVKEIHSTQMRSFDAGTGYKRFWVPNQIIDITVPEYIREKFV